MLLQRAGPALLVGLAILAAPLHADELRLRNGDRITGTVLRKSGDSVRVRTAYAGEINVRWDEVESIATTESVRLQAQGENEVVRVHLRPGADGEATIEPAIDGRVSLPLAQIAYLNPQPNESGEGTVYKGRINVSANATSGNQDSSRLYGELDFSGAAKTSRFSISLRADDQENDGVVSARRWRASGDRDRFIARNRFLYGRTSFEHDRFADVQLRSAVGAGHGWQLIDNSDTSLSLRTGLDYVVIDRIDAADENFPALGLGVKFRHRLFGRRVEVFHEQDGYWNLENTDDLALISRTGLRLPILPGLYTTTQVNLHLDNDPPPQREALDVMLLFGVGYEW
jgi:hypothetical protein